MTTSVAFSPAPILQFFDNAGRPNAGGSILTQVGGVNYPTYSDSAGATPLPNPIPLNSRGEVSTAAGASSQLFLDTTATYTFTLYDKNGNVLNQATSVSNQGSSVLVDLASTDEGKGADLVGNAVKRVPAVIEPGIGTLTTATTDQVVIAEFYGYTFSGPSGAGGGMFWYDSSDTTSGCVFTASFSGTTMTVTSVTNGTIAVGQQIITNYGGNYNYVTAFGTGSGGIGTYTMSNSPAIAGTQYAVTCDVGTYIIDLAGKRWKRIYDQKYFASWYGIFPDGTDYSTPMQYLVNRVSAAGGGTIYLDEGTYTMQWVHASGVFVQGVADGSTYGTTTPTVRTTITPPSAGGYVVDCPSTTSNANSAGGVLNILFYGLGAGTSATAIRIQGWRRFVVQNVGVENFADEGIIAGANARICRLENILIQNCVLNTTRAANTYALDLQSTSGDGICFNVEVSCGLSALSSSSRYIRGVGVNGDNWQMFYTIGESSDVGITVGGTLNMIVNCRGEYAMAEGWEVTGSNNQLSNCRALNCSGGADNTYDAWSITSTASGNQLDNCKALTSGSPAAYQRYGFNDAHTGAANKNRHSNWLSQNQHGQGFVTTTSGSAVTTPVGGMNNFTDGDTTPSVDGYGAFRATYTSPATLTNFTNGFDGQQFILLPANGNITVQHNGTTIVLPGAVNKTLTANLLYRFYNNNGIWYIEGYA